MSSFPETKAEKYVNRTKGKRFLQYNRLQLSRIYPRGQRLDSSNYDPGLSEDAHSSVENRQMLLAFVAAVK